MSGLTYGLKLIQPYADDGFDVLPGFPPGPFATATVPEPGFFWIFCAAVLGLFTWRRSVELRKRASRTD
ncbi:MAG: PEP-CTERM sorting domain-containing protein [Rhodanobacteraceae bacterium]